MLRLSTRSRRTDNFCVEIESETNFRSSQLLVTRTRVGDQLNLLNGLNFWLDYFILFSGKTSLIKTLTDNVKLEPKDKLFATVDVGSFPGAHALLSFYFLLMLFLY